MQLLSTAPVEEWPTAGPVVDALLTASRALVAVAARSLGAVEDVVTLSQYRALVVLASRGPQPVGILADYLGVHRSTATRLCDRLVSKSLILRNPSPESRRETVISLAPAGASIVERVTEQRRRELERIVDRIPLTVRADAVAALAAFAAAADEPPDDSWMLGWA